MSPKLSRRDDENGVSCGYRENDLKLEINRASRLVCIMAFASFFVDRTQSIEYISNFESFY